MGASQSDVEEKKIAKFSKNSRKVCQWESTDRI
jgi:hypothetical protein